VIEVPHETNAIYEAIQKQIAHGPYDMQPIYGDGKAGERIADILAGYGTVNVQKRIEY
jgi:hypothetical protein